MKKSSFGRVFPFAISLALVSFLSGCMGDGSSSNPPLQTGATEGPSAEGPAHSSRSVCDDSIAPGRLGQVGRWIVDSDCRVVILQGVNQISKLPPYTPESIGFGEDDLDYIASQGFNTIRLGFIWKAFEPTPGNYDYDYLESLYRTAQAAADVGLWVLFDFHQDMYNEKFNGEGFPDWTVFDDGLPNEPDLGFPGNYFAMPALWRAYDHFLDNDMDTVGRPMHEAFAEAWRRVASRIKDVDRLLGYDLWNEPFPGSSLALCANPLGCLLVDQDRKLTDVARVAANAVRAEDDSAIIFYEPFVTFNNGVDTAHGGVGEGIRAGMSFHNYCLAATPGLPPLPYSDALCSVEEQMVFTNAEQQSKTFNDTLMLSEFGASDDLATIERVISLAAENRVSWQYWAWWNRDVCCERPDEGIISHPSMPPVDANLDQEKLDVLVRAYPRHIAGIPEHYSFDRNNKLFELRYSTQRPDGKGRFPPGTVTEIFVPERHYSDGYRVIIEGGQVISGPGSETLRIVSYNDAEQVSVTVVE
ncbi:glycoside hydrolase family 5 protein [Marinobacter mobilis]|uniref:Endoglycosylceramidase n=1 Tax=Marinobacter mobilis TaxID=488533 RepID=A0A1H2S5C7_9GAMM|nr:cellulase family glycosylhydrolase [Marinobacter mobilis]SDW26778.1 endoglycosylceramidase [Marinobacter mobilis]